MFQKNLKETLNNTNKPLTKAKTSSTLPNQVHFTKKAILAATCLLLTILLLTSVGGLGSNLIFVQANSIQGVGVGIYWNQVCSNRTLSLDWGSIKTGSSSNLTIYVRNEYSSDISLRLSTSNWKPSATSSYMSLNWNYNGQVLKTNEVM
ncbi:MAG: hypothetical protein ACM3UN_01710, partial [Bacillota bacterium]